MVRETEDYLGEDGLTDPSVKTKRQKPLETVTWNGVVFVNTTPHMVVFKDNLGYEFEVPPCGEIITVAPLEEVVGKRRDIMFVKPFFLEASSGWALLERIGREVVGDKIVIGSIVAAQTYGGKVVAMTSAEGYERVPTAEKRMNPHKFTIYTSVLKGGDKDE